MTCVGTDQCWWQCHNTSGYNIVGYVDITCDTSGWINPCGDGNITYSWWPYCNYHKKEDGLTLVATKEKLIEILNLLKDSDQKFEVHIKPSTGER